MCFVGEMAFVMFRKILVPGRGEDMTLARCSHVIQSYARA